ncbi:acyltransferase [Candidatus Hydrogenedentota bacterium]
MNSSLSWRIRKLIAILISLMPLNIMRTAMYRFAMGYEISLAAKIGFATRIVVKKAKIGRAVIGRFNRFIGPFRLQIEDGAYIGSRNTFECGFWSLKPEFNGAGFPRFCELGDNTVITCGHYFDSTGGFRLGERSWIAGRDSQFWTHGAEGDKAISRMINIGSSSYIGSAVRFTAGSGIGDHSVVAVGSVVTERFDKSHLLVGGVPAKVIRTGYLNKNFDINRGLRENPHK